MSNALTLVLPPLPQSSGRQGLAKQPKSMPPPLPPSARVSPSSILPKPRVSRALSKPNAREPVTLRQEKWERPASSQPTTPSPAPARAAVSMTPSSNPPSSARTVAATNAGREYVYGDSTPFPYDIDFIRTIDDAVNCCVSLLEAETSILEAQDSATMAEQLRQQERVKLMHLANAVRDAILEERGVSGSTRVSKTGAKLLEGTRTIVEGQIASLEAETQGSVTRARKEIEAARAEVHLALEQFLSVHDAPKTDVELCVVSGESGAAAVVTTTSSFGFQASFDVPIKADHAWAQPRRVRELCEDTIINVPKKVGWIKKRIEPRPLKLDGHFIRSFVARSDRGKITFSKRLKNPETCEIEIDLRGDKPRAFFRAMNEMGQPGEAYELAPDDRTIALRLWRFVAASSDDLKKNRRAMKLATFDGRPISEVSPETLCRRMVSALSPIVSEIAQRSGASGELQLRRSLGAWERHENFITTEELVGRTFNLPIPARRILDPLCQPFKSRSVAPTAAAGLLPPASVPPMRNSSRPALLGPAFSAQEGSSKMFPAAAATDSGMQPIDVPISDISIVEVVDDILQQAG
ncbi:MAG: hypothetical protein ABI183_26340 [Polyangiaceae bacterium]